MAGETHRADREVARDAGTPPVQIQAARAAGAVAARRKRLSCTLCVTGTASNQSGSRTGNASLALGYSESGGGGSIRIGPSVNMRFLRIIS